LFTRISTDPNAAPGLFHHPLDVLVTSDVGGDGIHVVTGLPQLGGRTSVAVRVPPGEGHPGSRLGEGQGEGFTQPPVAASDQGRAALQREPFEHRDIGGGDRHVLPPARQLLTCG